MAEKKTKQLTLLQLRKRVQELEAILLCECGHLRSEHYDNDSPCYGGRSDAMKPTEGEWCHCSGFESADGN